jgi:hypothetical protein
MRKIGVILESQRFQYPAIEHVAMAAVIVIGLDVFELEQSAHRGTVVHLDSEPAGLFIQFHGEIGRFFIERMAPIEPASPQPVLPGQLSQVVQKEVGKIVPKTLDGVRPAFLLEKLEELAVGGDKLGARYHPLLR